MDVGFEAMYTGDVAGIEDFEVGQVVMAEKDETGYRICSAGTDLSYTYVAHVERVIDGDTILVEIDCGFNIRVRQRLRLRGIDAPEMSTKAGERARVFVMPVVGEGTRILVQTRCDGSV